MVGLKVAVGIGAGVRVAGGDEGVATITASVAVGGAIVAVEEGKAQEVNRAMAAKGRMRIRISLPRILMRLTSIDGQSSC